MQGQDQGHGVFHESRVMHKVLIRSSRSWDLLNGEVHVPHMQRMQRTFTRVMTLKILGCPWEAMEERVKRICPNSRAGEIN
jgi:hypothetical protein